MCPYGILLIFQTKTKMIITYCNGITFINHTNSLVCYFSKFQLARRLKRIVGISSIIYAVFDGNQQQTKTKNCCINICLVLSYMKVLYLSFSQNVH